MNRVVWCVVIVMVSSISCNKNRKEERPVASISLPEEDGEEVKQALEEVYLQETEEGKKRWELWAKSVELFSGKKIFKKVRFKFYRDSGILYIKGDEAEIGNVSGDINIRGNVAGKSDRGIEFKTDELTWIAKEERLFTEGRVRLMSETVYIQGIGFDTTPRLKEASIKGSVYVTFFQDISDEVPVIITSRTLKAYFGESPKAIFEGKVVVEDKRGDIRSQKLIISFSPDGRRVERSVADGEVEIITSGIEAECGKATFLNKEKKIVLERDPIIWHEKVKCRGDRIIYFQEERKVVVRDNIKGVFLPKSIDNISSNSIQ